MAEARQRVRGGGYLAPQAEVSSWAPLPLDDILSGKAVDAPPSLLHRSDGEALLYPGEIGMLYGEPEGLKTWLALEACRQVIEDGGRGVFVDYEDSPVRVVSRLSALGLSTGRIRSGFSYLRPFDRVDPEWDLFEQSADLSGADLVVVDGVNESFAMEGLDPNRADEVAAWGERLAKRVARLGPAVLLIDHVVKSNDSRGRYPGGSGHKLALVTGSSFVIEVGRPFGRGLTGGGRLLVTKDRPGGVSPLGVGSKRHVADVVAVSSSDDGSVQIRLDPPGVSIEALADIEARIVAALEGLPEGLESRRAVGEAVGGNAESVSAAIRGLQGSGTLVVTKVGKRYVHQLAKYVALSVPSDEEWAQIAG